MLVLVAVCVAVAAPALWLMLTVIDHLTEHYGMSYARDNALLQRERLQSPVLRDLTLARKMVDSPIVRTWAASEDDAISRGLAIGELESFRSFFQEGSYFVALAGSRHYYFSDGTEANPPGTVLDTLDPENPADEWFTTALLSARPFNLNVDRNATLGVTKVWVNVPIVEDGRRLGIAGTGIDLGGFIENFLADLGPGVSGVLIDRSGAIQAHEDPALIDLNTLSKSHSDRSTIYRLLPAEQERAVLRDRLIRLENGSEVETFPLILDGRRHLVAATFMPELGWFNLTLVDPSEVVGPARFLPLLAVMAAALVAVIVAITLLLDRTVLRPILELTSDARQMAEGQYDIRAAHHRSDEIGELTRAFGRMAATVRDHTRVLERRVRERTEELILANRDLEASNRQILDGIRCARVIQSAILPRPELLENATRGHFIVWKPRDIVGGDFYFCHPSRNGLLLGVVDCTGHGVPGAFMTMMAHAVISHVVKSGIDDDPAWLLTQADETVREALHHRGETVDAGMDMAVCHIAADERRLVFAGARISLWHVDQGEVHEIKGSRDGVGYRRSRRPSGYVNQAVEIGDEAAFYLTTDGLLDQSGGPRGFGFGRERFVDMIRTHAALPIAEQGPAFEAIIAAYQQSHAQRDDITFLGFRPADFSAAAESPSEQESCRHPTFSA